MEEKKPKTGGLEKIATFIVDRRNLFFLLYALALIFSVVASGWVKVENDITTYLPADTETRQGLTVMNDNFTTFGTARVMVSNVTYDTAAGLADAIEEVEGVYSVEFDDTADHYKQASALYTVTFDGTATDNISLQALDGIRETLAGYDAYIDTEVGQDTVLTFKADGAVVASETVDYGGSFDAARAPAVPAKDGCTAAWADFQTENIRFDQVVEAVYTPLSTVVAGSELREDGRPILLAEGSFGSGDLTMNASDAAPLATGKHTESWQFTLPESAGESWQMHYLPAGKNTAVYLRTADGSWRRADTTEDGSYLVFTVQPGEDTLAALEQPELPVPLLAGGIAAALLLLAVAALVRRKHKNHAKA